MSKYKETTDSIHRICPYCGYRYQVEDEDVSETSEIEECWECGKKYHTRSSVTVDHYANPDCALNGMEHQWETVFLQYGVAHEFCSICDKCKGNG